ncbi:MAG TPA: hypothetical protein VK034_03680 [Enhygromyxa sp.]|nr:hypothetical protein [Enhygromyxa sp.]
MFDFSQFYASGGVFMHPITLTAVVAITVLFLDARARKLGDDGPKRLRLADRLVILCVGIGLIGTTMGVTELCAALSMAPSDRDFELLARGGAIVPNTLTWSLMLALPLWIAITVMRHRTSAVAARSKPL